MRRAEGTRQRRWSLATAVAAICAALVTNSVAIRAHAQVTPRTTAHEIGDIFEDLGAVWASPFHARSRDWIGAGASAGTFALLLPVDPIVDRWVVDHPRAAILDVLRPFRENGGPLVRLATARRMVPISLALVLAGSVSDNRGLREAGYGCITGWALSNTLRYAIYAGVARDRPSISDGNQLGFRIPGGKWDQHAFPAGHAMNAFVCTSFWTERFDLDVGEPVLYATAAMAALARIADRRHWTTDTFVGAVVGIAVGRSIASSYGRREAKRDARVALDFDTPPVVILWRGSF